MGELFHIRYEIRVEEALDKELYMCVWKITTHTILRSIAHLSERFIKGGDFKTNAIPYFISIHCFQQILFCKVAWMYDRTTESNSNHSSYESRQANLCLRAFRHDKFQLRMPSHSEGPGIWFSVWRFLLIHCLYEWAAKVLARLLGCAGSPEPSLLA